MKHTCIQLASTEIWVVAAAIALSVLTPRALPLALGVAALFWLVRWIAYGRAGRASVAAVDAPVVLLIALIPVTLWATSEPDITRTQVYRLLSGIALLYATLNWATTRQRIQTLVTGIIIVGLGVALLAPISVVWKGTGLPFLPAHLYTFMPRLLPFAINANVMAGLLVVLLPFPLAFVLFSSQRTSCAMLILADVSTLMMLSILVATQSRGAIGALLVIILIIFMLRWRYGWLMALASGSITTLALLVTGIGRINEFAQSSGLQRTIETRLEIWSRAWDIVQDFPFTGIGMGTFAQVTNVLYPFFMNGPGVPHAHNLYLHIALDLGILGLVAWLALSISSVRASWNVYRHGMLTGDRWLTGLGLGLLCSQVALLVHGITDSVVWVDAPTAALVWGVWGIALAARHLHEPAKA